MIYCAEALVSLPGIKIEQGKHALKRGSTGQLCNFLLFVGGLIVRDSSITVFHLCQIMKSSVMQLASFHSAKLTFTLFSVDSTNLTGSDTVASRHGSEGFQSKLIYHN